MTAPIFVEHPNSTALESPERPGDSSDDLTLRVLRLEEDVAELRQSVTKFADVVVTQMQVQEEAKQAKANDPPPPVAHPGLVHDSGAVADAMSAQHRPWLLLDLLRDGSTILRMYFDPRYRVRRSTQLMVPLIVGLLILNCVFFNWVFVLPLVSSILEKLADIVLAVVLYKVLFREILRYRQATAQPIQSAPHDPAATMLVRTDPDRPPASSLETE